MSPTSAQPDRRRARIGHRPRVEGLELRALLSGNFPGPATFSPGGFTHTIELTKLVQDANNDGFVNLAEKNGASGGKYEFRGTLVGPSAPFHAAITIDIMSGGASIGQTSTITVPNNGVSGTFSILVPTGKLAEGTNNLSLRIDRTNDPGTPIDLYPFTVPVDTTSVSASIAPVAPDPRAVPVSAPIVVTFSGPINKATFATSALSLKRGTGANLLIGASGVTIAAQAGSSTTFNVGGLSALTATPGVYAFSVDSTKVKDPAGNAGVGTVTDTFEVIALKAPAVKALGPIANPARNVPLSEPVAVEFEQAIDASTFTVADLGLSLGGGANLLAGASGVTLRAITPTQFQVEGLAGLTGAAGNYVLSVDTKGIKNEAGTAGTTVAAAALLVDLNAPTFTGLPPDRTIDVLATAGGAAVSFEAATAADDFDASPTITYSPPSGSFLPVGVNTITARAIDDAGNVATATFRVTIVAPPLDQTAPTVVSILPTAAKKGAARFTVTFSEAMAPGTAGSVAAYEVRLAGKDKKFGTKDDVRSRIVSASYDGARSVTLTIVKAVPVGQTARVTAFGSGTSALADLAGNRLKGGSDHVALLKIKAPAKTKGKGRR